MIIFLGKYEIIFKCQIKLLLIFWIFSEKLNLLKQKVCVYKI